MRSVRRGDEVSDDRSTRAQIRDAAMARFASDGFHRATIRSIASDAGVSPALVLHHFGSKDGLRTECDDHVARVVLAELEAWMTAPDTAARPASFAAMIESVGGIVDYVGRSLVEGGGHADAMVDRFVDIAEAALATGEAEGTIRPSRDRRATAAVMVIWDLSTLILGDHLRRALGVDDPRKAMLRYAGVALDVFADGLFIGAEAGR